MATLMRGWTIGKGRACKHQSLPLPGHRTMAEVLAEEQREAIERGAIAYNRARKNKGGQDGKPPEHV